MMLPNRPPSTSPIPASTPTAIPDAPAAAGSNIPTHADYNLQPLAVPSLEHYVIFAEEGERFHIR